MSIIHLSHRRLLKISGEDKEQFLQGLISNDVHKVKDDKAIWSCFLTPQGKFLNEFFIFTFQGDLYLDCAASHFDVFFKKLKIYKLRSKVQLEALEPDHMICSVTEDDLGLMKDKSLHIMQDPRLDALGYRVYLSASQFDSIDSPKEDLDHYFAFCHQYGVAESDDLQYEKSILLENGFDELKAIDWDKGCYLGQELTARTKYRGIIRKRLFPAVLETDQPIELGADLFCADQKVGKTISQRGKRLFVMVRLDQLDHIHENQNYLSCGELKLELFKPDWIEIS